MIRKIALTLVILSLVLVSGQSFKHVQEASASLTCSMAGFDSSNSLYNTGLPCSSGSQLPTNAPLLGTNSGGTAEPVAIGTGLSLSGGTLSATGGGGAGPTYHNLAFSSTAIDIYFAGGSATCYPATTTFTLTTGETLSARVVVNATPTIALLFVDTTASTNDTISLFNTGNALLQTDTSSATNNITQGPGNSTFPTGAGTYTLDLQYSKSGSTVVNGVGGAVNDSSWLGDWSGSADALTGANAITPCIYVSAYADIIGGYAWTY